MSPSRWPWAPAVVSEVLDEVIPLTSGFSLDLLVNCFSSMSGVPQVS
jgi:hypothetical protein